VLYDGVQSGLITALSGNVLTVAGTAIPLPNGAVHRIGVHDPKGHAANRVPNPYGADPVDTDTTRVGGGPFPTELTDEVGAGLAKRGNEFGSVTGRPRRCGWLDVPLLRRSFELNGVDGTCVMKLDVLDGMDSIAICTHYMVDGRRVDRIPSGADAVAECVPVYETLPGWNESTVGVRTLDALPANARAYLARIEALTGVPIAMVSTGPDRDDTILLSHPLH